MDTTQTITTETSQEALAEGQYYQVTPTHTGIVKQVLGNGQYLVVWVVRKPKSRRKPRRVNTFKRHGNGYLFAASTLDAINAAYTRR